MTVFLDVKFAGIDGRIVEAIDTEQALHFAPGLGALEDHGDFLALHHFRPAHLECQNLAGFESHKTMRRIFHIGGAAHPVWDAPRTFELFVLDEVRKSLAEDVSGFGITHKIHRQIHHVEKVDQGTAAGHFLGGEPAPEARDTGAADPFGLRGVDGAHHALTYVSHHGLRLRPGAVVEIKEHLPTSLFCRVDDGLHFCRIHRGRLFGKDMLSRFETLDG